jgi:hypothetical protein
MWCIIFWNTGLRRPCKCEIIITYQKGDGSSAISGVAVTAFRTLSTQMPHIRQPLSYTHTFQLNTPNYSTTCIRGPMTSALNSPLNLTGSMSSQTRQHPPLSSSNRHFILLFSSVAPKLLPSNDGFWTSKAETFWGSNLDQTVGIHYNILEC